MVTERHRTIKRQIFNEMSPQMILTVSVYRNGGTENNVHICSECQVAGLKIIRDHINEVIESVAK